MATSSKNPDGTGRDLHAEREQAQQAGDAVKVADLDRQIAEQQNPSQPGTDRQ